MTGCHGCQGHSPIYMICLAKALFFPAVDQGILLFLSLILQTGLSFSVCCDVNHIFSLKPWLSQHTCSPAVRLLQVTSLNKSRNFPNLASFKMSSCSPPSAASKSITLHLAYRVCVSVSQGLSLCLYLEVQPSCRSVLFGDRLCSQRGESLSILTFIFNL